MNEMNDQIDYPKATFLILFHTLCESFCFYGILGVLILYLRNILLLTDAYYEAAYHTFCILAYVFPIFGAIVADNFIGKFRAIIQIWFIYILGIIFLSLSTIKSLGSGQEIFCWFGLIFIAMGSGGIRPCTLSFGADQFILPEQPRYLYIFFHLFYFCIYVGICMSIILILLLRDNNNCYQGENCYSLSFGIPAIIILIITILVAFTKRLYRIIIPINMVLFRWTKCIGKGIREKITSEEKVNHWLDHSKANYGNGFVRRVKNTLQVLLLFLPLPLFWACFFYLKNITWTSQARQMNCDICTYTIPPEQMVFTNPILVIILIPIFICGICPPYDKINIINTSLRRMTCGGILTGLSFLIAACISLFIDSKIPNMLPKDRECDVRIYNPLNCTVTFIAPIYISNMNIKPMEYIYRNFQLNGTYQVEYTIKNCSKILESKLSGRNFKFSQGKSLGYYLSTNGLISFDDDLKRDKNGNSKIRVLVDNPKKNVTLFQWKNNKAIRNITCYNISPFAIDPGTYTLENFSKKLVFQRGAIYTILVSSDEKKMQNVKLYELLEPNSVNILLQLPQYIVFTLGEVLFFPAGLEFAYTQAPISMKTAVTAVWYFTIATGKILLVIVAPKLALIEKQWIEFLILSGIILLHMILFALLAVRYEYVSYPSLV